LATPDTTLFLWKRWGIPVSTVVYIGCKPLLPEGARREGFGAVQATHFVATDVEASWQQQQIDATGAKMKLAPWLSLILSAAYLVGSARSAEEPPTEWIEPTTGHRVVRLSREPESASLYFHQNPFSADGKKMVFTSPSGIWTVNLETRELAQVVKGRVAILTTGRKTGDVYYMRRPERPIRIRAEGAEPDGEKVDPAKASDRAAGDAPDGDQDENRPQGDIRPRRGERRGRRRPAPRGGEVFATNLDTGVERHVASLSKEFQPGNVAINSDETTLVVIGTDPDGEKLPRTNPSGPVEGRLLPGWASGDARVIYTINLATGEVKIIHRSNDWLNHLQCSPTDPQQILFCHEGPWQYVDRTWLIRTDGSGLTQVHPRTMDMEIGGHEFFSNDGKMVWYDLQTPRSLVFWLAGYDVATGKRTWYHHERNEWSVHYNVSPDGKLFAGDGGGPDSVANRSPSGDTLNPPGNGMWIYLFRPELDRMTGLPEQAAKQIKTGMFHAERLVDMSKHRYTLEPNVIFTPDGKWIVFRSNMHGPSHVYAVEVAKAN
jgi:oligogalacturonide lyase